MVLFSHPTGNANVRAAGMGLAEAKILYQFHTAIASFSGSALDRLGAFAPFSEIRRRRFDLLLASNTHTSPWWEIGRLLSSKAGLNQLIKHETGVFCIDNVYKQLDKEVAFNIKNAAKNGAKAIYAYEDGSLESFKKAKEMGLQCLYDLPIGYWKAAKRLLNAEIERWPDWVPTLTGFADSAAKLERKDEELRLADRIFVASNFTKQTLNDFSGHLAPIEIIPYGFPPVSAHKTYSQGNKLKILFVGGLSQRKGLANLFEAIKPFKQRVQLTIIGRKIGEKCPVVDEALTKHTWIPSLPNFEILKLMREHDVLIFPSLFEGFGLVITEAMSQGTAVITTDRTVGPDFITHGENGWLIGASNTEAIQFMIEEILQKPQMIAQVGKAARETARLRPWARYKSDLSGAIKNHLSFY
ncbi:MAG: glycosyl transferase family 1 [Daejeonella sp.]|nr:glycosyl transferase family 1 [Daejeonella sp.]